MTRWFAFRPVAFVILALTCFAGVTHGETVTLRVMGWNVESGDADPEVIADRIAGEDGIHVWGLSEVAGDDDAESYRKAAEVGESGRFEKIVGNTGGSDRLVILYDKDKLRFLSSQELDHINVGGHVRAPLFARFKGKTTGQEFVFMVNHLYRSRASRRHQQATLLNRWARSQTVPVIAAGDYNFDWDLQTGDINHHNGYDNLTKDEVFIWVRPDVLEKAHASDYNSVLDFVFVAGTASGWEAESTIVKVDGDFPDDDEKSDHRPVDCIFTFDTSTIDVTPPSLTKEEILEWIEQLEQQLEELKAATERL